METAADTVEAKPLGRILADERERQGLSRAEAAQRLHMSAYQVEALETGDYTRLPKGTFLRGFVRNYAKLLGLDPALALTHLADAAPRTPAPGIVVPTQNIRFDPLGERLSNPYVKAAVLAAVAVALIFAAMYWWLFVRPAPPAAAVKRASKEQGPPQQIAAASMAAPEPVANSPAPVMTEEPKKAEPARAEAPKKSGNTAISPTLKFRFRGDSWVEVRDGQGKVVMQRLASRGSEAEVAGRPPLTVIVGNAPAVQVLYNDREFPLEAHTKVAVARFTVE